MGAVFGSLITAGASGVARAVLSAMEKDVRVGAVVGFGAMAGACFVLAVNVGIDALEGRGVFCRSAT